MVVNLDKKEIQKLRKKLPHGSFKILAEKHGMTQQAVSNIFRYKHQNIKVIEDAIELAAQAEQNKKLITDKIKAL